MLATFPGSFFETRFREAAARVGLELTSAPNLRLNSLGAVDQELALEDEDSAYGVLGTRAPEWLAQKGRGPFMEASSRSRWAGAPGLTGEFRVIFSLQGEPVSAIWAGHDPFARPQPGQPEGQRPLESISAVFVASTALSRAEKVHLFGQELTLLPLSGEPPETLVLATLGTSNLVAGQRSVGSTTYVRERLQRFDVSTVILTNLPRIIAITVLGLGTLALSLILLARRRVDFTNGAILAAVVMILSLSELSRNLGSWLQVFDHGTKAVGRSLVVLVLWAAAESWIRSTIPGFRTSLDTLRSGRVGPRSGEVLLSGWFAGAAVAGLFLGLFTLATFLPGVSPSHASVNLPVFGTSESPIYQGIVRAGVVLLVIGAALQLSLIRRVSFANVILAGFLLGSRINLSEFWPALVIGVVLSIALVLTYREFGLAALLTASIISLALPTLIFCGLHLDWLAPSFTVLSVVVIAPLVGGFVGLSRPEESEGAPVGVPAFVRRLEEERRLKYEMDLLARMQLGLLPQETPKIEGYEIAAKSILATEAGGDLYDFLQDDRGQVWIAAGDVSGHGYSCAIAQAMTKAGLASLIGPDQHPATVLGRLDRVLRISGAFRTFTSLVLLRLDPASGEGLIANAGHPYPLLGMNGVVQEIAIPSLPLGKGPPRSYDNRRIEIARGSVLVFCSDGLFEALDASGAPYGFERLRSILSASRDRSAGEILEVILGDWRKHAGSEAPLDDTTVVVLRRTMNDE